MSLPVLSNTSSTPKSFWERKEGVTGMITLSVLAVAGFFGLKAALPTLISVFGMAITVLGQGIAITVLMAILAGLLFILTNKKVHLLASYMFKSVMRKITGVFVEIDPIGLMKNIVRKHEDQKAEFDVQRGELRGVISKCRAAIRDNEAKIEKAKLMAVAAQKANNTAQLRLSSNEVGRVSEYVDRLKSSLAKMEMLANALTKYSEAAEVVIADVKADIAIRQEERQFSTVSNSAMKGAMAILRGSPDERELWDMAIEATADDYAKKMGEIEEFMLSTKSIIDGIDLQNGMWEESARKQLADWENKSNSLLLGNEKSRLVQTTNLATEATVQVVDYGKIFK